MLRFLTTLGILIAIALPLIDMVLYRPARRALANPRLFRIERLIYVVFLAAALLQAVSSFGSIVMGSRMSGWLLNLHMAAAGLFAVTITALGVLWAEQASFAPEGSRRFYLGEKVAFWLMLVSAFATIGSAMLGMMSWFGTDGQIALLRVHRYSGLVLLICVVFHGYRVLLGRPAGSGAATTAGAAR